MYQKIQTQGLAILVFVILFLTTTNVLADTEKQYKSHIAYTDHGKGKPIVLIHAFPTDQRLWMPQEEVLRSFFRVITLDLWGFGQSSPTHGQAMDMNQYADEVKQLLDDLNLHKAVIGGESMGGYIALAFLKKYPDRVSGLILSDTQAIADTDAMKEKREQLAQMVLEQGPTQLVNDFVKHALWKDDDLIEERQFLKDIVESQTAHAIASALRGMALREDTESVLEATSLPILILTGDKDVIVSPQQSENMHQLAKNSKLVVIKDAGHLSNLDQPERWNQAVIDMFE